MARIADYSIISDGKVKMKIGGDIDKSFNFNLPSNYHRGSRGVLAFMLDTVNPSNLKFKVEINGSRVFNARYNSDVFHTVHEVVPGSLMQAGGNNIEFTVTGGGGELQMGDAVLWFQANV